MDLTALKRILVPTDFSDPSQEALDTAAAFARKFGATLDLVHVAVEAVYPVPPPIDVATLPIDIGPALDRSAAELAAAEARLRAAGVACESATLIGRPDQEIVTRARTTGAGLIVMGTHGRSGLAHALLGSNAERVVQHAPCPVLIVPKRGAG
ncbi:MAG TPA: universal stress protein [Polyangia bacterium]|nr:universal stress protein [Polyangia bacterium]